jgi:hypothetical protein
MGRICPEDQTRTLEETRAVVLAGMAETQARVEKFKELASVTYGEGNADLASRMGTAILALEVAVDILQAVLAELGCGKRG